MVSRWLVLLAVGCGHVVVAEPDAGVTDGSSLCPERIVDGNDVLALMGQIVAAMEAGAGADSGSLIVPQSTDGDLFAMTVMAALSGDDSAACALPRSYRLMHIDGLRVVAELGPSGAPAPVLYWGTYAAPTGTTGTRLLAIEAPHPIFDTNTERQATDLFVQSHARFLLVAGAHRCANSAASGCSGTTTACGSDANYRISDAAHTTALPFFAVHAQLSSSLPALEMLQLHGNADACPTALVADGSGTWNEESRAGMLAAALASRSVTVGKCGAGYPQTGCTLCATDNVEARFTAGARDACTLMGAQYGRLTHVEQLLDLRRTPTAAAAGYQTLIDAVLEAYP